MLEFNFELIEDNNIDSIEDFRSIYAMNSVEFQLQDKINEMLQGLKQLNREIQELKER